MNTPDTTNNTPTSDPGQARVMGFRADSAKLRATFADRLKARLKVRGVTFKAAADWVGLTQAAISHLAKGLNFPSYEVACELARRLGVSLDYLSGLTDDLVERPTSEDRHILQVMRTVQRIGWEEAARRLADGIPEIQPGGIEFEGDYDASAEASG